MRIKIFYLQPETLYEQGYGLDLEKELNDIVNKGYEVIQVLERRRGCYQIIATEKPKNN